MFTPNSFSQWLRKRRRNVLTHLVLAFVSLMLAPAAQAQYSFIVIDYPGAESVHGWALNAAVRVPVSVSGAGMPRDGLVYDVSTGQMTPMPSPGPGLFATAVGINNAGVLAGSYSDGESANGFVLTGGTYSLFTYPGSTSTHARAINSNGWVTGYAEMPTGNSMGVLYDSATGNVVPIEIPGARMIIAQGINSSGVVVGSALMDPGSVYAGSPGGQYAWVRQPWGALTLFRVNGLPTRARGINDAGQIAGWFSESSTAEVKGFVVNVMGSPPYESAPLAIANHIAGPGAVATFVEGINGAGFLSGSLYFADGSAKAFIAVPPGAAALKGLARVIGDFSHSSGIEIDFTQELESAMLAVEQGDLAATCAPLQSVISGAEAQAGKKFHKEQAAQIIGTASAIRRAWGC